MIRDREGSLLDERLRGLLETGIDDLAKYRIVQHLHGCDRPLDAPSLSASLGLRPGELVAEALDSLAGHGILVREQGEPPLYALSPQPSLRRVLRRLFLPLAPQDMGHLLHALAAASLAKAKARASDKCGGWGSAEATPCTHPLVPREAPLPR